MSDDDKNAVSRFAYHHLTVGHRNHYQCVHKHVGGFEVRMSPCFASEDYNDFDITGGKPWERAVDMAIADAPAPIDYIDIDPIRAVVVYKSKADLPCEVIIWKDTTKDKIEAAMREGLSGTIGTKAE